MRPECRLHDLRLLIAGGGRARCFPLPEWRGIPSMSAIYRNRLLCTSLLVSAAMLSTPAFAQEPATTPPGTPAPTTAPVPPTAPNGSEIVITGTRIFGITNANNPSPISVTTSQQIQLTKSSSVEDVLQRMIGPDNTGFSNTSNNGGTGASTVSLRNLGPARTLVLIDGTRLIPSAQSPSGPASFVDVNAIPVAMIERVEVLRDGASSVYGADAIAGVVNIITKQHASGFHIEGGAGKSQHGGGDTYNVASTFAVNSDRANVIVGLSWDHRTAINGWQRDWANDPHIGSPGEGGSAYRTQLDTLQSESPVTLTNATVVNGVLQPAGTTISNLLAINGQFYTRTNPAVAGLLPNTLFLPHVSGGVVKLNANGSRADPYNTLAGSLDRKEISLGAHYDLTDGLTAFADGFFSHRKSHQLLRPEPLLGDTIASSAYPGFEVAANAPGNTTGTTYFAYLTPDQFGPRTYDQTSDTWRIRGGLRGELAGFHYEFAGVEQQNDQHFAIPNSGNFLHLGELTGQLPCIDVPGGCKTGVLTGTTTVSTVPVTQPNWFGGPENIFTPDQLAYAKFTANNFQHAYERYLYGNISGSLFRLPGGDAKMSIGGEYRKEFLSYQPDELVIEGLAANQTQPTRGGYNVKSAYGELFLPLLSGRPFFKELDLTPSARIDDYSTFGSAKTWKVGVNWALSEDIRLRGSYATGFRAPQVTELFGGQGLSDLGAAGDPCETNLALATSGNGNIGKGILTAGSTCSRAVAGGAAVTTFTDPLDQISGSQIQTLVGGNPALQPEKSRGWTVGTVLTPRFLPGLSFEGDLYRTKIRNQILTGGVATAISVNYILLDCYGPAQNATSCAAITRAPSGAIAEIISLNTNVGTQTVKGYDLELTYDTRSGHMNLPFPGSIRLDAQLSRLLKNDISNADGSITHYAGTFNTNSEYVFPKWKGLLNLDYSNDLWGAHWDSQYSSKVVNFNHSPPRDGNVVHDRWIHSASVYFNLHNIAFMNSARLIFGVDNLFDKDPPFISSDSTCKCNSIAGPYDFTGRFYYFRFSADFDRPPVIPAPPPVMAPPPPPPAAPATITCPDGLVILAGQQCPAPPPPPPPPAPAPERG
ncbi:MAG: TonB-dependent receptor domain-containing protein [Sphingomonas sp.]